MTFVKQNWVALIAIVIAIGFGVLNYTAIQGLAGSFGAIGTRFPDGISVGTTVAATKNKFTLGTTGTALGRLNSGQCYFAPSAATIAASTTIAIDCQATQGVGAISGESALTGITLADNVIVQLSTTTAKLSADTLGRGLRIEAASASTTTGYITVLLHNGTGTTFTWPVTGTASGTASYIVTK